MSLLGFGWAAWLGNLIHCCLVSGSDAPWAVLEVKRSVISTRMWASKKLRYSVIKSVLSARALVVMNFY